MENERRNDTHQNIRVVLPPRPERKAKGKPEPEAVQGENQPVRVTIPPHPSRRTPLCSLTSDMDTEGGRK